LGILGEGDINSGATVLLNKFTVFTGGARRSRIFRSYFSVLTTGKVGAGTVRIFERTFFGISGLRASVSHPVVCGEFVALVVRFRFDFFAVSAPVVEFLMCSVSHPPAFSTVGVKIAGESTKLEFGLTRSLLYFRG
jgi:hypothetical protein